MNLLPLARVAGLLALTAYGIWYSDRSPAPAPPSAPPEVFSAERAMAHLGVIAQRPHPSGSADHARVRAYLMAQLTALGLAPQIQEATGIGTRYAVVGRVRNVMARIPGRTAGGPAVLLMSHYDGVGAGPAAADAGSGTAALLETARALRAGGPLARDVIVLFTDSEETGLNGAAAFAAEHPWARDAAVILNFEARGVHGPSRMFETGAGNLDVVRVLRGVPGVRATSLSVTVYRALPNDTDLSEMHGLGRPAMNFAFIGGVQRYHTSEDDTTHLSRASLQHHGVQALALARAFGDGALPRPATGDAAFFDFPLLGLVVYPIGWSLPLALLGLALVVAALVLVARREPRSRVHAALGAAGFLLTVIAAALIGIGAAWLLARVHVQLGGAPQWSAVYGAAIGCLALMVMTAAWRLTRRGDGTTTALGALLLLALITTYLAATMPGVSYLFAWPLLFAGGAALLRAVQRAARVQEGFAWLAAAVALILLAPTAYAMVIVALGLDLVGATLLTVLASIAFWLVAPLIDRVAELRSWMPTLAAASAAVLLLGVGFATVRTAPRAPAGASFVYAVDLDSNTAYVAGSATTPRLRSWIKLQLNDSDVDSGPEWLKRIYGRRIMGGAVPVMPVVGPTATIVADSATARGRVVALRVRADTGTRAIQMSVDSGEVVEAVVDGRPVDRSRYRSRQRGWSLDYVAPPDSGFVLRLTIRADSGAVLNLLARRAGIPASVVNRVPTRPAGVLPIQSGDQTLIHRRVRL